MSLLNFFERNIDSAFCLGITPALYPLLSYYESNYNRLNSWEQFLFFTVICFVIPIFGFFIIKQFYKRFTKLPLQSVVLFFSSTFLFITFILVSTSGVLNRKHLFVRLLLLQFVRMLEETTLLAQTS